MDAVRGFFTRYHAVPANDAGPEWESASDDALIGWLTGEFNLLRRGDGDPRRKLLRGAVAEAWSRVNRLSKQCPNHGTDWSGRNTLGRLLATLAMNADLLTIAIK